MTPRALPLLLLSLMASPALAFECSFDTECMETEACADSAFLVDVLVDDKILSTEFGDLTIVAIKQDTAFMALFATGSGAEYMMSVTPDAARLTTHINEGPMSITYLGHCKEAF